MMNPNSDLCEVYKVVLFCHNDFFFISATTYSTDISIVVHSAQLQFLPLFVIIKS